MSESVVVRCPDCRRDHRYAAPAYPCRCGAPVSPPLNRFATPTVVTHRTWDDDWVAVRCGACGREDQWPHPELGCPCGTVVRVPVAGPLRPPRPREPHAGAPGEGSGPDDGRDLDTQVTPVADRSDAHPGTASGAGPGLPDRAQDHQPARAAADQIADRRGDRATDRRADQPTDRGGDRIADKPVRRVPSPPRPVFRPVTIRSARDAVTAAAHYLRWLGYREVRRAEQGPPSGVGLAARGVLAQVDPTVHPASLRDVECLWLTAMSESAACVYFSLAGFAPEARERADGLGIPLFVLDLTGTPQPVNGPARELIATGA